MTKPLSESTTTGMRPSSATETLSSSRGVFDVLEREHAELKTLVTTLLVASDLESRMRLWREVSTALLAHEGAELQVVYSVFPEYPSLQYVADEHAHQARLLENLVAEVSALPMGAPDWSVSLQRLFDAVSQHIEEEESDFFPRALAAMGEDRAALLELPYLSAQRSLSSVETAPM